MISAATVTPTKYSRDIIGDKECPQCREMGRDKSGNHLILFSDGSAYCNRCQYSEQSDTFSEGTERKVMSAEGIRDRMDEVLQCPIRELTDRQIPESVAKHYDVRVGLSEMDGRTVTSHFYPQYVDGQHTGYQVRVIKDKFFYHIGTSQDADLWGKHACAQGGKKLFITEGMCDAMALYHVLKDSNKGTQWADIKPNVVSLPNGSGSAIKSITKNLDFIENFQEVILCFDQDVAGQKAAHDVTRLLPGVKLAKIPLKDANDMLLQGRGAELKAAVMFQAKMDRPDGIKSVMDLYEDATKMPEYGITTPWPSMDKLIFGLKPGFVHIVGAAPKIGKTEFQHQMVEHLAQHHNERVGVFDLENPGGKTVRRIAGKFYKKPFHKPDGDFTHQELKDAVGSLDGKLSIYDSSGVRDWDTLKRAIRIMAIDEGITYFMVDPLTALVSGMASSEANDALNSIMTDFAGMAHELQITFFLFSHLNPVSGGKTPHERGGEVLSSQFTGSRAMEKWAHYGWGIQRSRDPELEAEERNLGNIVLLFDREFGMCGKFPCYYDPDKGTYLEPVLQF